MEPKDKKLPPIKLWVDVEDIDEVVWGRKNDPYLEEEEMEVWDDEDDLETL